MKSREFIGEAFEELTINEMKMVQGSGDVEAEGHITASILSTGPVISPVASPVLVTLVGKC